MDTREHANLLFTIVATSTTIKKIDPASRLHNSNVIRHMMKYGKIVPIPLSVHYFLKIIKKYTKRERRKKKTANKTSMKFHSVSDNKNNQITKHREQNLKQLSHKTFEQIA